jgi:hypothetical protein
MLVLPKYFVSPLAHVIVHVFHSYHPIFFPFESSATHPRTINDQLVIVSLWKEKNYFPPCTIH